jgi:hypothetical protein
VVNLVEKVRFLYPNSQFGLLGELGVVCVINDVKSETIAQWPPHLGPQPTAEELDAVAGAVENERQRTQYARDRLAAYKAAFTVDDELEALNENADGRPEKFQRLKAIKQAIKERYPKPPQ